MKCPSRGHHGGAKGHPTVPRAVAERNQDPTRLHPTWRFSGPACHADRLVEGAEHIRERHRLLRRDVDVLPASTCAAVPSGRSGLRWRRRFPRVAWAWGTHNRVGWAVACRPRGTRIRRCCHQGEVAASPVRLGSRLAEGTDGHVDQTRLDACEILVSQAEVGQAAPGARTRSGSRLRRRDAAGPRDRLSRPRSRARLRLLRV